MILPAIIFLAWLSLIITSTIMTGMALHRGQVRTARVLLEGGGSMRAVGMAGQRYLDLANDDEELPEHVPG